MKRIRHRILFAIICGCFVSNVLAQTDNKLACVALVKEDSVVLRWVPASVPVWQIGVKYGYVIKTIYYCKERSFYYLMDLQGVRC